MVSVQKAISIVLRTISVVEIYFHSFLRFPSFWNDPVGYLIAVVLQLVMIAYPMCYMGSFLSLAFAAFMLAISVAKELKGIAKSINKRLKNKREHPKLLKQFIKFHGLQTDAKQFSNQKFLPHSLSQKLH